MHILKLKSVSWQVIQMSLESQCGVNLLKKYLDHDKTSIVSLFPLILIHWVYDCSSWVISTQQQMLPHMDSNLNEEKGTGSDYLVDMFHVAQLQVRFPISLKDQTALRVAVSALTKTDSQVIFTSVWTLQSECITAVQPMNIINTFF